MAIEPRLVSRVHLPAHGVQTVKPVGQHRGEFTPRVADFVRGMTMLAVYTAKGSTEWERAPVVQRHAPDEHEHD